MGAARRAITAIIAALAWEAATAAAEALPAHESALRLARAGQTVEAIPLLQDAARRRPDDLRIRYDLVATLAWAGRDAEAWELKSSLDLDQAPPYVLEALGKSARNLRRFEDAARLYGRALHAEPDRLPAALGLGLARADLGLAEYALDDLEPLAAKFPNRPDLREAVSYARERLWEQVAFLYQQGRFGDALAKVRKREREFAPPRTLELLADAARKRGDGDALRDYEARIARAPATSRETPPPAARVAAAASAVPAREPEPPAGVLEERDDLFGALAAYQKALTANPRDDTARQGQIRVLRKLGTPHLAAELAERQGVALPAPEREQLARDRAAITVRWGEIASDRFRGAARFPDTDTALAETERLIERYRADPAQAAALNTARADRILALRQRFRMREAIALYEEMVARGVKVPAYATSSTASAYLYERKPKEALKLYREAVREQPENLETQLGLFYAFIEAEDFDAAFEHIDALAAAQPRRQHTQSEVTARPNPGFSEARRAAAMARAYGDMLQDAEARLAEHVREAPFDLAARNEMATVYLWRGWPRRAEKEWRLTQAVEPDNINVRLGLAKARQEQQDFREAEQLVESAAAEYPENLHVQDAKRQWRVYYRRSELSVEADAGRSTDTAPTGTNDRYLDVKLYSPPIAYDYRLFAHARSASADFPDGRVAYRRLGAGLEYRSGDARLLAEASQAWDDTDQAALWLSGTWTPDDAWRLRADYETSSYDVPLQARKAGVDASRVSANAGFRVSESRDLTAGAEFFDFDDGNERSLAFARWFERWWSRPHYRLESIVELYGSRNTLDDAPYFNPSRDFSATLTVYNDWMPFRHYLERFRHRLALAAGIYEQEGFDTGTITGIEYDHIWDWNYALYLRYGLGRWYHPYDGETTRRDHAFVNLNWRF